MLVFLLYSVETFPPAGGTEETHAQRQSAPVDLCAFCCCAAVVVVVIVVVVVVIVAHSSRHPAESGCVLRSD